MKATKGIHANWKKMGLLVLVTAALMASSAHLATASQYDRHTAGLVGTILVGTNGGFLFNLSGLPNLCTDVPLGSAQGGYNWITVTDYATPDAKKQLLAVLTSAKIAGRQVIVRALNNYTKGEWGCRLEGVELQ